MATSRDAPSFGSVRGASAPSDGFLVKAMQQLVGEAVLLSVLGLHQRAEVGGRNAIARLQGSDMAVLQPKGGGSRPNTEPVDDFGE